MLAAAYYAVAWHVAFLVESLDGDSEAAFLPLLVRGETEVPFTAAHQLFFVTSWLQSGAWVSSSSWFAHSSLLWEQFGTYFISQ